MHQFDVYSNPSKATSGAYPYIVDIQSPVISEIATRIVVPLVRKLHFKDQALEGLPPTINYENPDPDCNLDYVPNEARKLSFEYALSNSFGFGGTNGALLLKRYQT